MVIGSFLKWMLIFLIILLTWYDYIMPVNMKALIWLLVPVM